MTRVVEASPEAIAAAATALRAGRLVAFPTETVYGLGALAGDEAAVAGVFRAKGRPANNPLILHVADVASARRFALFDERAERLAAACWPGPMTLVLRRRDTADGAIAEAATAGLDTVAVRIPGHPVAQALLEAVAAPVAAPSANRSGRVSPTTAAHVLADLDGRIDLVLDAGPVAVGIESTVIDLSSSAPARILRPGGLTRDAIERVIGDLSTREGATGAESTGAESTGGESTDEAATPAVLRSPGLLARHYAPRTPLRLDAEAVASDEALLAFGPQPPEGAAHTLNLSPSGDLEEAARNLYAMLRRLDALGCARIAVMRLPCCGLGEALADRLRRAAHP